jgi:hypothetical protein
MKVWKKRRVERKGGKRGSKEVEKEKKEGREDDRTAGRTENLAQQFRKVDHIHVRDGTGPRRVNLQRVKTVKVRSESIVIVHLDTIVEEHHGGIAMHASYIQRDARPRSLCLSRFLWFLSLLNESSKHIRPGRRFFSFRGYSFLPRATGVFNSLTFIYQKEKLVPLPKLPKVQQ